MPALNFQSRFAGDIVCGCKRQTIRATRKRPIKAGDTLYLYMGQRQPGAALLRTVKCRSVAEIKIALSGPDRGIVVNGVWLFQRERLRLAKRDGFGTVNNLVEFFVKTHGLRPGKPFLGQVIRW